MIFVFDDFELDAERLELRRGGKLLKANRTVLATLACLVENAGRLVTKDELVDEVWEGRPVADTVITVATARLRKTLGQRKGETEFIENVYGRGYRFVRPVSARDASTRPPPALVEVDPAEPPFVGRERVLHRLRHALAQAHGGRGGLCALIGEAGIGKTQVVEAFERGLSGSEVSVSWGFCHELGDTPPLSPWRGALRPVLARLDGAQIEKSLGALAVELGALTEAPEPLARAEATAPGGPPGQRGRLFEAITRAVALAARQAPVVVVLDDLHRADDASLELLAHLVDELAQTRVLVIATLRAPHTGTDAPRERHLAYAIGHRNCERILLEPLSLAEVAEYVGAVLEDADGALGRAVFDKSEGNAFYMCELARQLADMELPTVEALEVPEAALELIRQRLARLDADSRCLLSAAAVIGRSFELGVLQSVTGSEPSALMANLDEAIGAEVLVAAPDSVTAFAFRHELMRAALYDALPLAERRAAHLKTALALEKRLYAGEPVAASALAFHFYRALPQGDPRKTVDYCRAAAGASSVVFANAEVARYMRHALEALDLMERPSVRLRMGLLQFISMHTRTTDPAEFGRTTREILRLASETGDGPNLVMAGAMLNPALGLKPEPEAATAFARALEVLPPELAGLRAVALAGSASVAPACYDEAVVAERLDEAKRLCADARSATVAHGVLLARLYLRGGPAHDEEERAVRAELEALARAHPRRMPVLPGELAYSRAITALQRAERDAAAEGLERAIARYREIDQREGLWHAERAVLLGRVNAGEGSELAPSLLALHARAERQSLERTAPFVGFDRAVVLPELGAAATLDESLRRCLLYDRTEPPSVWSMKVRALAAAGWVEAADTSLRAVPAASLSKLPCDRDYLGTLGHLTRAALQLGAEDYYESLYGLLAPHVDRFCTHVSFGAEGAVPQLLGMLASALGWRSDAIAHMETAVEMNARAGLTRREAEAQAQLAELRAGG